MKLKVGDLLAVMLMSLFLVLLLLFMITDCPKSNPNTIRQQIKDESIIQ